MLFHILFYTNLYNFFTSLLYLEVHFVQPIKHNICFYKTNMINKDGKKRERGEKLAYAGWPPCPTKYPDLSCIDKYFSLVPLRLVSR